MLSCSVVLQGLRLKSTSWGVPWLRTDSEQLSGLSWTGL